MDTQSDERRQAIRMRRQLGFHRLNQLSFMQIITSCPLFIAGVVTLVMALPHVEYPVFNFGPVFVSILVFPMALIGLLATRIATENVNEIETTRTVRCMILCNFALSILCCVLTGASSFYSFYIVEQCSDTSSEFYELCLPNSKANVGLSLIDGVVCLILLVLSVLGIAHFCTHGFKLCCSSHAQKSEFQLRVVLPGQIPTRSGPTMGPTAKSGGRAGQAVVKNEKPKPKGKGSKKVKDLPIEKAEKKNNDASHSGETTMAVPAVPSVTTPTVQKTVAPAVQA